MYFRIISQEEQYLFSRNTFQICIWRGNQIKNTRRMLRDWYRGNQSKSGVRWTDKEVVIPIYNGILLNHKKEWIWVSWTEVAEPRACYTEWSKSEREKQILYISTYISEKAMAPHSSTLAWKIPWTEEPGRLQSMGSLRVRHNWATSLSLSRIGEGTGNPLQCSCLENPRDRGAW